MTQRVVDVLEAVEVEHEDGERLAAPAQARTGLLDLLHEQGAVGETGQQVVMRHEFDALVRMRSFGDVFDHAEQICRIPILLANREAAGLDDACAVFRLLDLMRGMEEMPWMLQRFP